MAEVEARDLCFVTKDGVCLCVLAVFASSGISAGRALHERPLHEGDGAVAAAAAVAAAPPAVVVLVVGVVFLGEELHLAVEVWK